MLQKINHNNKDFIKKKQLDIVMYLNQVTGEQTLVEFVLITWLFTVRNKTQSKQAD